MDNDNLSKIPVSELTPENLNSLKGGQEPKESRISKPRRIQRNNRLPLLIAGIVLLIGVGVALFFIFRKPAEPENPTPQDPADELPVVWEPSENSEDPSQEFYDYHQGIINSPDATPEQKFNSTLEIANLYTTTRHYAESEAVLNGVSRETLTLEEQFRLYSVYKLLYEQSGNPSMAEEYSRLADEALDTYWRSRSDTAESTNGE